MIRNQSKIILAAIAAVSVGVAGAASAQDRPFHADGHRAMERHPEIHRAINRLESARHDLQVADRDFGGHRAAAQLAIDNALRELRAALKADRH